MHTIVATNRTHLDDLIIQKMEHDGPGADLNGIDVSRIRDFAGLFEELPFVGNVSQWNTGQATNMHSMFMGCPFNGDISGWNVANVSCMNRMFSHSAFNGDVSRWNVRNVDDFSYMFQNTFYNGDLSQWSMNPVAAAWQMCAYHDIETRALDYGKLPLVPTNQSMKGVFGLSDNTYDNWVTDAPIGINHWEDLIRDVNFRETLKTEYGRDSPIAWPHQDMLDQWLAVRSVHAGLGLSLRESAIAMVQLRTTHASGITDMVLPCLDTEQDMHA